MSHRQAAPPGQDRRPAAAGLTEMEEQILAGLAGGKTAGEICRELGISRSLYQVYVQMLRRCLGARTTVEAVAVWVQEVRP